MAAGERHARNYYAWNYGRDVVRLASTSRNGGGGGQPGGEEAEEEEEEENGWQDCVTKVHKWCLAHPRDISGWSFLAFLLNTHPSPPSTTSQRLTGEGKEAETMGVMREWNRKEATIREIIARTQDFVEKYGWKGESIEWFLGSIT